MAVSNEDLMSVRMTQTEEHLLKKLGRIFYQAEEANRCLTSQEVDDVKDIWEALKHVKALRAMSR